MDSEYGNDFITVTDEEGNEFVLEHLDTAEVSGCLYMAFLPADMDEEDEDYGLIILKVIIEDNEEVFVSIDDESEEEMVLGCFLDRLYNDGDEEN